MLFSEILLPSTIKNLCYRFNIEHEHDFFNDIASCFYFIIYVIKNYSSFLKRKSMAKCIVPIPPSSYFGIMRKAHNIPKEEALVSILLDCIHKAYKTLRESNPIV